MGRNIPVKLVVVILLLGVICFFYYRYELSPQLAQLRNLHDQVTATDAKLSTLKEVQQLHGAFVSQNASYVAWIDQLAQITPVVFDQHEHTRFLLDLQAVGKASGITYTSIQISDASMGQGAAAAQPAEVKLAKTVGVTLDFTAKNYATMRQFQDTFRTKFKYVMVSSNLTVSHDTLAASGQGNPYTCSMTSWMVLSPDATIVGAPAAVAPTPVAPADVVQ
jgi:Tfp pilus assembly protein PilO